MKYQPSRLLYCMGLPLKPHNKIKKWASKINAIDYNAPVNYWLLLNYRLLKIFKKITDRPGHDFRYAINSRKIRKELNWKPKTKPSKGIENTIRWYISNVNWLKYCSKKYKGQRLGIKW